MKIQCSQPPSGASREGDYQQAVIVLDATTKVKRKTQQPQDIDYRREEALWGVRRIDEVWSWRGFQTAEHRTLSEAILKID